MSDVETLPFRRQSQPTTQCIYVCYINEEGHLMGDAIYSAFASELRLGDQTVNYNLLSM